MVTINWNLKKCHTSAYPKYCLNMRHTSLYTADEVHNYIQFFSLDVITL